MVISVEYLILSYAKIYESKSIYPLGRCFFHLGGLNELR